MVLKEIIEHNLLNRGLADVCLINFNKGRCQSFVKTNNLKGNWCNMESKGF